MATSLHCWNCGSQREIPAQYAGCHVRCPDCSATVLVAPDPNVFDISELSSPAESESRRSHPGSSVGMAAMPVYASPPPPVQPDGGRQRVTVAWKAGAAVASAARTAKPLVRTEVVATTLLLGCGVLAVLMSHTPVGIVFALFCGVASVIGLACGIGPEKRRGVATIALVLCVIGAGLSTSHRHRRAQATVQHPEFYAPFKPGVLGGTSVRPAPPSLDADTLRTATDAANFITRIARLTGGSGDILFYLPYSHAEFMEFARLHQSRRTPGSEALTALLEGPVTFGRRSGGFVFIINRSPSDPTKPESYWSFEFSRTFSETTGAHNDKFRASGPYEGDVWQAMPSWTQSEPGSTPSKHEKR